MQLHEALGKHILARAGFRVPDGGLAYDRDGVGALAREIGLPCAVKAQILSGRRGLRGLVRRADTLDTALLAADWLLNAALPGDAPRAMLVERWVSPDAECYLSVSIAEAEGRVRLIVASEGGVAVESAVSERNAQALFVDFLPGDAPATWQLFARLLERGFEARLSRRLAAAADLAIRCAKRYHCTLLEINPLAMVGDHDTFALDAKVEIDDAAPAEATADLLEIFGEAGALSRPSSNHSEIQDFSFSQLSGDVAVVAGGAGLAMLTNDALVDAGLKPANFLDLQGSSKQKMIDALCLVSRLPQLRGILTNNAGGLTSCVQLAEGIVRGSREVPNHIPLMVKLRGADQEAAWALINERAPSVHVFRHGNTEQLVAAFQRLLHGGVTIV